MNLKYNRSVDCRLKMQLELEYESKNIIGLECGPENIIEVFSFQQTIISIFHNIYYALS